MPVFRNNFRKPLASPYLSPSVSPLATHHRDPCECYRRGAGRDPRSGRHCDPPHVLSGGAMRIALSYGPRIAKRSPTPRSTPHSPPRVAARTPPIASAHAPPRGAPHAPRELYMAHTPPGVLARAPPCLHTALARSRALLLLRSR